MKSAPPHRRRLTGRSCILFCCAAALSACVSSPGARESSVSGTAAEDYLALAMGYFEAGDLSAARFHLDNARDNDAGQAKIDHIAALLAAADGDVESAEMHFRNALRLTQDNSALRNNFGVLLYSLERDEEALTQFHTAAADENYPGRAHALENLGRALLRRQRPAQALEAFAGALSLNGELAVAALESSLIHRRSGNQAEARRLYGDYLKIAARKGLPHSPRALLVGAEFARQSGNRDVVEEFGAILGTLYPETVEYRRYVELMDGY